MNDWSILYDKYRKTDNKTKYEIDDLTRKLIEIVLKYIMYILLIIHIVNLGRFIYYEFITINTNNITNQTVKKDEDNTDYIFWTIFENFLSYNNTKSNT